MIGFYWVVRQDMKFLFLPIFFSEKARDEYDNQSYRLHSFAIFLFMIDYKPHDVATR